MSKITPLNKEEELASRIWRICTKDERTLLTLETMLRDFVKGPIKKVSITHRIYNDKAREAYEVPYSLINFFIGNRMPCNFQFDSFFKKYSTKPFVFYKEDGNLPKESMQRMFGGSLSVLR